MVFKILRPVFRNLSDFSTELLRSGESDLMLEVQRMIVRLKEIQEQLLTNEDK